MLVRLFLSVTGIINYSTCLAMGGPCVQGLLYILVAMGFSTDMDILFVSW